MRTRSLLVLLPATLAVLTSCASEPGSPVIDGDDQEQSAGDGDATTSEPSGSWVLTDADPPIEVPDGARVTMQVRDDGERWQVGGTSACNEYFGHVVVDGERWRSEGYGQTDMACEDPRMSAEQAYLDALQRIERWTRPAGDELVLQGGEVELRYAALPAAPISELTQTRWVLDGLLDEPAQDAAVRPPAPAADEATLYLDEDGSVEVATGCRTFSGEWTEVGDEVLFPTFGEREDSPNVGAEGTPTCDEDVVEQERHVLSVVGDGFRAEIEGELLTLISRDGLGLTFRAAG